MAAHRLSKSKILSGLQCPKRLYLEVHNPELIEIDAELERRFETGHQVGEIARQLYPGGKLIKYQDDLSQAVKETKQLLEDSPHTPLCEATFTHKGVLVRADVLTKDKKRGFKLVEVKSSTSVKDYHLSDCAVQSWVMEGAGCPVECIELAHIDNTFVYPGNGDYEGLLINEDVTKAVRPLKSKVTKWVKQCQSILEGKMPDMDVGKQCKDPYECPFLDHCSLGLPEYPVTIFPYGAKVAAELLSDGIEDVRDVPPRRLKSDKHEKIRRITVSGRAELDKEAGKYIRNLPYPRYYLDFETIMFGVPIWAGTRPYRQLPFQWSCHIEDKSGKLRHAAFLDITGDAPMRPLGEKLLAKLGKRGAILVYSGFEKARLNELAVMFPDLASGLNGLIERLVDLLPLTKAHYYHPEMKGSWSLKDVLPTVAPDLDYGDLDEVQTGTDAQLAYLEAVDPETSKSRRAELKSRMLEYCKMDTLGLVKLAEFFQRGLG